VLVLETGLAQATFAASNLRGGSEIWLLDSDTPLHPPGPLLGCPEYLFPFIKVSFASIKVLGTRGEFLSELDCEHEGGVCLLPDDGMKFVSDQSSDPSVHGDSQRTAIAAPRHWMAGLQEAGLVNSIG
jgi:hypothetical protein